MTKKILIGSIITICILVGVSFTSVVGYNSGASDVKASPLFNIRSSRAIDEENVELSCEYVGKGEEINIQLPKRNNKIELVQKMVDKIRQMNNKEFNKFVNLLINQLLRENIIMNSDVNNLISEIKHIKNNLKGFDVDFNNNNLNFTWFGKNNLLSCWQRGCFVITTVLFFAILVSIPGFILWLIFVCGTRTWCNLTGN